MNIRDIPCEVAGRRAVWRYADGPNPGDGEVAAWVELTDGGTVVARRSNPGVGAQPWDPPLDVVLRLAGVEAVR